MKNLLLQCVLCLLVVVGCTPVATYPPVENKAALSFSSNSANEPVPTIMANVISYAHSHFSGVGDIVFSLPEGVDKETYLIVAEKLGGATPMTSPNEIAYHITELRVRGFHADADIVFPSTDGGYGVATVHLSSSLVNSWTVTRDRVWLIPTKEVPAPNCSVEEMVGVETLSQ